MTSTRRRQLPAWMVGSSIIAVSMGLMNVATYAFTLITARVLGPREYGALAALLGVMLVLNVLSLGLMATAARRVSAAAGDASGIEHEVMRTALRAALVLTAVGLVATPLLTQALRLDSWVDAALTAVAMFPLTIMGAQSGILQGERRWFPLALIFLGMGVGRFALGALAVAWRPDTTGAMVGVVVGGFVPAVIGWLALRHPGRAGPRAAVGLEPATTPLPPAEAEPATSFFREVTHNSHVLLAFFALSNADVIVSRSMLSDHESGLYAGGLILAKAVLFLPQFVVVLVFPSMAATAGRHRMQNVGLALVAAIGASATLAAWLLPDLAVLFVGGKEYDELTSHIWAFAAVGTLLALLQMLVYGTVARQHRGAVWFVWTALVVLVAVALTLLDSIDGLLATVLTVQLSLLVVLGVVGRRQAAGVPGQPDRLSSGSPR